MSSLSPSTDIDAPLSPAKNDLWTQIKTFSPVREIKRLGEGKIPCGGKALLHGMGAAAAISTIGFFSGRGERLRHFFRGVLFFFAYTDSSPSYKQAYSQSLIGDSDH
jgi:hypothetical protein